MIEIQISKNNLFICQNSPFPPLNDYELSNKKDLIEKMEKRILSAFTIFQFLPSNLYFYIFVIVRLIIIYLLNLYTILYIY